MSSSFKHVQALESDMFDAIEMLHLALQFKRTEDFNMALALLESLNDEYKEITQEYYITQTRMIQFHEKKWEM